MQGTGLRGVRVGEASQPGPTQASMREIDMTLQDSSDKEPIVRTGSVPPVATMVDQEGSASPSTGSVPQCQPQRGTTGRRRLVLQFEVDLVTSEGTADKQMKMNQST